MGQARLILNDMIFQVEDKKTITIMMDRVDWSYIDASSWPVLKAFLETCFKNGEG